MTLQFELVQKVLDGDHEDRALLIGPHRRLVDAWLSESPGDVIAADIAALVSQVLRHERYAAGISDPSLRLNLDERGISPAVLARSNLDSRRYGLVEHLVLMTGRWNPEWLQGDPRWIDVACASPGGYRGLSKKVPTYSRPDIPVAADPALTALAPNVIKYRSKTQATAVRTAVLGDPASTLHVVLPTGTGKSIVGLAPGMLRTGGNTVFVVPTIALALDQERAAHQRFPTAGLPSELAYYGDRSDGGKENIRQRLREGTQRVVFTSPEAMTGSLSSSLYALASSGNLTSIVIDEAHLIRTWGLDFRPEYQLVSALVNELRAIAKASGFREPHVILLTGTLSEEGLELNDALFHGTAESTFIGSTFLRTELRYLLGESPTREARLDRVVEAMYHLPRPAIIYVTRKSDAEEIAAKMKEAGFARVSHFHGDLDEAKRLKLLQNWAGDGRPTELDVVVGTSAFGLGVDQSDVRTVIHACVPALVDRFYQEVGRAGRDGHAAVSVWLPAPDDVAEGRGIEGSTLIGGEKTWNRWDAMRINSTQTPSDPGLLVVDTTVVPRHVSTASDANRLWNRNTLTLMERAGLVSIEATPPPEVHRLEDEDDGRFDVRKRKIWEEFRNQLRVRIAPNLNLDKDTFEARLEDLRTRIRTTEKASHTRMSRLLERSQCWADALASEYTFREVGPMRASIASIPACSGCPAEEHKPRPDYGSPIPLISDAVAPVLLHEVSETLRQLAGGGTVIFVSYTGSLRLKLQNLIQRSVLNGIRGILAAGSFVDHPAVTTTASRSADEGLVWVDTVTSGMPKTTFTTPTLILLDGLTPPNRSWLSPDSSATRVVVVPSGMVDPEKNEYKISEYRAPHWELDEFLRRI